MRRAGKYKTKRGGGRNFSRHMELDANGTAVPVEKKKGGDDSDDDDDDDEDGDDEDGIAEKEEEEEESSSEEEPSSTTGSAQPELSRAERRELKKQGKATKKEGDEDAEGDDPLLANPNRNIGRMKISDLSAPREPTRREREAKEKVEAKDKYWKLQAQGKTEQAKTDLARLAKIRAEREAAQAKRKAEQDAKTAEIEAKKAAGGGKR